MLSYDIAKPMSGSAGTRSSFFAATTLSCDQLCVSDMQMLSMDKRLITFAPAPCAFNDWDSCMKRSARIDLPRTLFAIIVPSI